MKTLVDKTYNNKKIKEINEAVYEYLNKKGLSVAAIEPRNGSGIALQIHVVRKGELFKSENILFNFSSLKSYKPDDAYNSILNLFEGLMAAFGWDDELSIGSGWRLERSARVAIGR